MNGKLQSEVRQSKPFGSLEQEAHLNILRTAAVIEHAFAEVFRPHGITVTQYNVLRILRGAGEPGLCRNEIRGRLVAQVPDATRLLDRMEAMGLVTRARDAADRRMVTTQITRRGIELVEKLEEPVRQAHAQQLGHLTVDELETMIMLLEKARGRTR
jgi:DNA-binding MarR family transcriptional regulator